MLPITWQQAPIRGSTAQRSGVAQRQSIRLLTEGLWVRIPPPELMEGGPERAAFVV